jgi:hypothetical protein
MKNVDTKALSFTKNESDRMKSNTGSVALETRHISQIVSLRNSCHPARSAGPEHKSSELPPLPLRFQSLA